jgi:pyruvate/2-oxoglutarate dehydrogenase complex dihydrolipoamide dehydrogenase (E3) component
MKHYDYILLGTGQTTGTLMASLIPTGKSIAVIEAAAVGGSCVNYGCTPTKTMVAAAKALHQARQGDFFGFEKLYPKLNYGRMRERMNEIRHGGRDGISKWLEGSVNVDLIRGKGVFTGPKVILVNGNEISGTVIFINTGTHHWAPPAKGLNDISYLDSEGLLALTELPKELLILGGGYIGLEFAQIYNRLGSKVTVIQRNKQLMPHEDEDVAISVQEKLAAEGVVFHLSTNIISVQKEREDISLELVKNEQNFKLKGSHLLVATGRRPNTRDIGLEAAGISIDERGFIKTGEQGQTSVSGVFALGDVNGKGAFTHTSVNDAEIVLDFLKGGKRKISDRLPVYALFTDPPLGRVGMTEKEAIASGRKVLKATREMKRISRAKEMGETHGFAKLLVDADTDLIIGASIHGLGGDEIINMFAAIMHSGIPCKNYREVVLVHPTVSELMPWVLDGLRPIE